MSDYYEFRSLKYLQIAESLEEGSQQFALQWSKLEFAQFAQMVTSENEMTLVFFEEGCGMIGFATAGVSAEEVITRGIRKPTEVLRVYSGFIREEFSASYSSVLWYVEMVKCTGLLPKFISFDCSARDIEFSSGFHQCIVIDTLHIPIKVQQDRLREIENEIAFIREMLKVGTTGERRKENSSKENELHAGKKFDKPEVVKILRCLKEYTELLHSDLERMKENEKSE